MIWKDLCVHRMTVPIRLSTSLWLIVFKLGAFSILHASPENIYFIGNSFTWDAQPQNFSIATIYPNGLKPEIGWSIYSGKSLTFIVDNPEKAVTEVGLVAADFYPDPVYTRNYETDLPAMAWDAISMQPSTFTGGLFLDTEITSANTIIAKALENQANQSTVFYIYGAWSFQQSPDRNNGRTYSEAWLSGYSQNQIDSGILPNIRKEFEGLFWERMNSENPNVTIKWIPVGETLYRIDQELQKGLISGVSGTWDLFDQHGVHLHDTDEDGIAGRYISHITTLCTVWGAEPSAFQTKYDGVLDSDFKALVDQVVWDTVLEYYPAIVVCESDNPDQPYGNLIRHPGLPGDYLQSTTYKVAARLGENDTFEESAVLEYATNFGADPVLNDPFNISNPDTQDALAESSHWTSVSYGNDGNPLQFEISLFSGDPIITCEVFPGRYQIPVTIEDGTALISLHAPDRYLYLIINDDKKQPLFLFVDPLEENPPSDGDEGVIYYGPGIHDIDKDFAFPEDKHTIYIALGAYVKGSIFASDRSDITVRGRGILSGESYGLDPEVNAAVHFSGEGTNQILEGITSIRPIKHHIISRGTLHTKNVKCLSYNNTTDGIVVGDNSLTEHCFFKVNDDVIKLYNDNQIVRDIVVYRQTNGAIIELGWSDQNSQNSLVQRIDIVQDDSLGLGADGPPILGWAHNSNPGIEQKGHVIEDVRADHGVNRLMELNIDGAPGFMDIVCRNWNIGETTHQSGLFALSPGSINISFENIISGDAQLQESEFENAGNSTIQLSFSELESGDSATILKQPESLLVEEGDTVMLTVSAEGVGAIDYQWRKNGLPMVGATETDFSLQNLVNVAAGEYDVQITNPFGTTTSQSAFVTFTPLEQSIDFPTQADLSILDAALELIASASSNLPVEIEVLSGPATLEDSILILNEPGEVVIRLSQGGNSVWSPATTLEKSFFIYSIVDTWRLESLGSHENSGDVSDLADPDFDQIPNLFEYFLGTSPTSFDSAKIMNSVKGISEYTYEFTQDSDSLNGLHVSIEASSDLLEWIELDPERIEITENSEGDLNYLIKADDLPVPYFIRVNISSQ
jgi:hypothetical protein